MNRYQVQVPRTVISIAAVAMTALTLGLFLSPAALYSGGHHTLATASRAVDPAADAATGDGIPIVVYGVREQETASRKVREGLPLRKEQS